MKSLIYKVDPTVSNQELQDLLAEAWAGYQPRPFGNILSRSLGYIACWAGGELVGFVNLAWDCDKHAFILDTTVRRSHQHSGIGSDPLRRAAGMGRERGAEWLHVDSEPHLVDFCRACGFRDTPAGLMKLR
jgi:GNAT superfamily N-acetyltransferase